MSHLLIMQLNLHEVATLDQVTCGRAWAFVEITASGTCIN